MINFCTLFDSGYLSRGIVMVNSLLHKTQKAEFLVHILALDFVTERFLIDYYRDNERISVKNLESLGIEYIWNLRKSRSHREFCWGLSAVFSNNILEQTMETTVYLDADIFFFSDPTILLDECADNSVAAIPHRFPDRLKFQEVNGIYNVQWVQFKYDSEGCLASRTWRSQCEASSTYAPEIGIVGDQKYLDDWHFKFKSFKAIQNVGAGLAPWNHENCKVTERDKQLYVDEVPLIFYHFHSFAISENGEIKLANSIYGQVQPLPMLVYLQYLESLSAVCESLTNMLSIAIPGAWKMPSRPSKLRNLIGRTKLLIYK